MKWFELTKEQCHVAPDVFCKKSVLKNFKNSQENTCTRESLY